MATEIDPGAASAALRDIERGRQLVVDQINVPAWYWWALAVGWLGLGVISDLDHPWLTTAATLIFGAAHASVAQIVSGGRRPTRDLSVRADVAGRRTPALVIGSLIGLAGLTTGLAFAANADGARHPATTASVIVAVIIVLGGPRLMAAVRQRAAHTLP